MPRIIFSSILLLFVLSTSLTAQTWVTDFGSAKKQATEENKYVLMVFQGSDWCVPCIKLHREVWETPEFEAFAEEHLVTVQVDFPRRKKNELTPEQVAHNERLAENYNRSGVFPFVVITDPDGNVLGETGYKNLEITAYLDHLKTFFN